MRSYAIHDSRRPLAIGGRRVAAVFAAAVVALTTSVAVGRAQGASAAPPPPSGATGASAPSAAPAGVEEGFSYRAEGRRDPFVSLLRRGTEEVTATRARGLGGLDVNDVSLRGIVATQGIYVAMVQAPDNRTYLVRQNDTLRDARVKAITADAVVFLQKVSDPLDVVKEREVRKPLRPNEEGK